MAAPSPAPSTLPAPLRGGYGELAREIRELGLMQKRPGPYALHAGVMLLVLAGSVVLMVAFSHSWWLLLLAPVLAVLTTQSGFLGHDIGHRQVSRNAVHSRALGVVAGNLFSGLSYGWWVAKHNAHHAHPNDLESDPDVRAGVFVWAPSQADPRQGVAAWWTRHQAALFFPLLLLEALNLHISSFLALRRPGIRWRGVETALLAAHFIGYFALLFLTLSWPQALVFIAVHKGLQGLYLGCSFAPNHKGMPVLDAEQAADPLLRQVLTSRNVHGGPFTDAALGGLNYQIEHHLFPSMPRANLRHAQPVVRRFCAERGIPYVECSALASYAAALRHLHHVGDGLRH
ncbi:fatty acid desaturase family protein [Nocardioides massiliensis]|uniref:Fatty acid desaturase n=1 Tax=Nocardioides massiliensis TaxID=1325935 RepID=A0ABT9NKZ9_9ACTN|nr:acyl-CoA desaturase [Nocardioides massiliensis]MDP9821089.1 fatty acid desaturase [Nocardioides massiliensis]